MKKILLFFTCLTFMSCEQFDYNVYETHKHESMPEVTTAHNIQRLLSSPAKDTLHIVFIGDTQRFYDEVEDVVDTVNNLPEVDAVFITGDITDFGTAREYEWINRELRKLKVPFLTVIGNHDYLANSSQLYTEIYGPLNYSFIWNGIHFIMHNTNGREVGFNGKVPDLDWLREQVYERRNSTSTIFVSHVPPYDVDFDNSLEDEYSEIVRESKNLIFSACGHRHNAALHQPYGDEVWYVNTSSPHNRVFSYVTIYPNESHGNRFNYQLVPF